MCISKKKNLQAIMSAAVDETEVSQPAHVSVASKRLRKQKAKVNREEINDQLMKFQYKSDDLKLNKIFIYIYLKVLS